MARASRNLPENNVASQVSKLRTALTPPEIHYEIPEARDYETASGYVVDLVNRDEDWEAELDFPSPPSLPDCDSPSSSILTDELEKETQVQQTAPAPESSLETIESSQISLSSSIDMGDVFRDGSVHGIHSDDLNELEGLQSPLTRPPAPLPRTGPTAYGAGDGDTIDLAMIHSSDVELSSELELIDMMDLTRRDNEGDSDIGHFAEDDTVESSQERPALPRDLVELQGDMIELLELKISLLSNELRTAGIDSPSATLDERITLLARNLKSIGSTSHHNEEPSSGTGPPIGHHMDGTRIGHLSPGAGASVSQTASPYFASSEGGQSGKRSRDVDGIPATQEPKEPVEATPKEIHPWSDDLMAALRNNFSLQYFRRNQLPAINETLSGKDVLVLMPTGGGKSLCYQLPAVVTTGATTGTTIVVSPLISLMMDQVTQLKSKGISADMINGTMSLTHRQEVIQRIRGNTLKLLYVSPEMLAASNQIQQLMQEMYENRYMARLVIDEAHCVSSWGHDFRPDYKELVKFKTQFPGTPIMALTATANKRVLLDISQCLRDNSLILTQSFNRTNLFYEVRPKGPKVAADIAEICRSYTTGSGIIYCNSKRQCEDLSAKLKSKGIRADFYHAGLDTEQRDNIQKQWQENKLSVICATIAFGMGIDKPDVRYVIHYYIPRTMEGYYQETGRAGRDGKQSECILYYTKRDATMLFKLIDMDKSVADRRAHKDMLNRVVQYCDNDTDCRRRQILQYFDETFDSLDCHEGCDNCRDAAGQKVVQRDLTEQAIAIIKLLQKIAVDNIATSYFVEVVLGSERAEISRRGHDRVQGFGALRNFDRRVVERLVDHLIGSKILEEQAIRRVEASSSSIIRLGPGHVQVLEGHRAVFLAIREGSTSKRARKTPTARATTNRTTPQTGRRGGGNGDGSQLRGRAGAGRGGGGSSRARGGARYRPARPRPGLGGVVRAMT